MSNEIQGGWGGHGAGYGLQKKDEVRFLLPLYHAIRDFRTWSFPPVVSGNLSFTGFSHPPLVIKFTTKCGGLVQWPRHLFSAKVSKATYFGQWSAPHGVPQASSVRRLRRAHKRVRLNRVAFFPVSDFLLTHATRPSECSVGRKPLWRANHSLCSNKTRSFIRAAIWGETVDID